MRRMEGAVFVAFPRGLGTIGIKPPAFICSSTVREIIFNQPV
jgi:hypothetical protein